MIFIESNGYTVEYDGDTGWIGEVVEGVIDGAIPETQIENTLRDLVVDPPILHEI